MRRGSILLCLTLLSICVSCAEQTPPNASSAVSQLVGSWEMVEDQALGPQGEVVARDPDVVGMIVYTPEGRVAVQIMYRQGRPVVSTTNDVPSTGVGLGHIRWSTEDARATIDTYDAYFGTYEVGAW